MIPCRETFHFCLFSVGIAMLNRRLNLDFFPQGKGFCHIVTRSRRGAWKGGRDARAGAVELPLNVTNLRILP